MAWSSPRVWVVAEIVTAAIMNTHLRDQLRYLKGLDSVVTIQNGLIVDNSLGTEYLTVPSLTTTQRNALSAVNGMIIYNSTLTVFERYEAGAWLQFNDLADMTIASAAQGDIFIRGASVVERLGAGTSGLFLKTQGAGANPVWATPAPPTSGSYTGDSSGNKAIAHGLGYAPKGVFILRRDNTNPTFFRTLNTQAVIYCQGASEGELGLAVTIPDATNFYVGNAANYGRSANFTGIVYDWMAV